MYCTSTLRQAVCGSNSVFADVSMTLDSEKNSWEDGRVTEGYEWKWRCLTLLNCCINCYLVFLCKGIRKKNFICLRT